MDLDRPPDCRRADCCRPVARLKRVERMWRAASQRPAAGSYLLREASGRCKGGAGHWRDALHQVCVDMKCHGALSPRQRLPCVFHFHSCTLPCSCATPERDEQRNRLQTSDIRHQTSDIRQAVETLLAGPIGPCDEQPTILLLSGRRHQLGLPLRGLNHDRRLSCDIRALAPPCRGQRLGAQTSSPLQPCLRPSRQR